MGGACYSPASPPLPPSLATRAAAASRPLLPPPPPRFPRNRAARSIAMASAGPSSSTSTHRPLVPANDGESDEHPHEQTHPPADPHGGVPAGLLQELISEGLVWSSLHGLVVGHRNVPLSGTVPGVGMVHAPFALLPTSFPRSHWRQACDLAPIFNELVDRVSLDGKFLQDSLSRTREVDNFTSRLLDIHAKTLELNKQEDIRLGLHRSDYMLDAATNQLYQIELNTISSSFPGLSCLVSELHRSLLNHYGKQLGLDSRRVPGNTAVSRYAEALAKAWNEYNDSSSVVMVVIQPEERNMYDQYWLSTVLKEIHGVATIRKTLAEVDSEGELLPDGTLCV